MDEQKILDAIEALKQPAAAVDKTGWDLIYFFGHRLMEYGFYAIVAAVIVMLVHRAFQPFLLSTLDEVRESTKIFRETLTKKSKNDADKDLLGRLTLAYAVVSGLVFVGIILLISNLATPVG